MGNGNRAQQKRERNAKDTGKVAKSQTKAVRFSLHSTCTNEQRELTMGAERPGLRHPVRDLQVDFPQDLQGAAIDGAR